MNIYSNSPYFDDYDSSKNYTQILSVPGRGVQARELTQMQTIQRDFLERLGNAILKDGAIVSGCVIHIDNQIATIESGKIFLGGLVRNTEEVTLDITGTGLEYITVQVVSQVITEVEDVSLVDPAQGFRNSGLQGAHRERQTVEFSVNGNGTVLYTISNGRLVNEATADTTWDFLELLARRTYDENGNYKISGLNLIPRATSSVAAPEVSLTSGKAYIRGYEVSKATCTTIPLDVASDTSSISNERDTYSALTNKRIYLNYSPINTIQSVNVVIFVEGLRVEHTLSGGSDALTDADGNLGTFTNILSSVNASGSVLRGVSRIYTGDAVNPTNVYTMDTDFMLVNDCIDWSPAGNEPEQGTSYYVDFFYSREADPASYSLINSNSAAPYLQFNDNVPSTASQRGSIPYEGTEVIVDYDFFLSRRDLILMDNEGTISVIRGVPDTPRNLFTPVNQDKEKLEIGYVTISPGVANPHFVNYKTVRLTQAELYNMSLRLDNLEYNISMSDLDTEAEAGESATSLKGVYTDGFIGTTKCDLNASDFRCGIDYENGELTVARDIQPRSVVLNTGNSTVGSLGRVLSCPFTEVSELSQPMATGWMLVNPYAAYNPLSFVSLSPPVDNWVETENIQVYETEENTVTNTSYTTSMRTLSRSVSWWDWLRNVSQQVFDVNTSSSSKLTYKTSSTSTSMSSASSVVKQMTESLIMYMRQRTVAVEGSSFTSNQDSIVCYFNDIPVNLTATGDSTQGTEVIINGNTYTTVRADSNGKFTAEFTIPANTPCGVVEVKLSGSTSEGTAEYKAEGILKTTTTTTTTTITTTNNVLVTTHTVRKVDPLAQTFIFAEDTVLTKADLYFREKDTSRPLVVQVRNVVNGYPGETCFMEVEIDAADVVTSPDASLATTINFNQPVYCEADTYYAIIIMSDSNAYSMYLAQLAQERIDAPGEYVISNAYAPGVLFSSSNSSTWTAHQDMDLKFTLYRANYISDGILTFNRTETENISNVGMDALIISAEYLDYKNNGITWEYALSDSASAAWMPIDPYVLRELPAQTSYIYLRARLGHTSRTSPFLAADCLNLLAYFTDTNAVYLSRSVNFSTSTYDKLRIIYQAAIPAGSQIGVFYQTENGGTWTHLAASEDVTCTTSQISEEFSEYDWEIGSTTLGGSKSYLKIRINLQTSNVYNRPRVRKLRNIMKI